MPSAPLARDRFERSVDLPEKAAGFVVYRVPSDKGGKPVVVSDGGFPLELQLETTEERLWEMLRDAGVARPGRYRLDVVDKDGEPLGTSCWVRLKPPPAEEAPRCTSPSEFANAQLVDTIKELSRSLMDSNRELANANARMAMGVRRASLGLPAAVDDDDPSSIRELVESAIKAGGGESERELTPEEQQKRAQTVKTWIDVVATTLTEHGPKAWSFIQMLQEAAKAKAALPTGGGAPGNGVS